MFSQEIIIKDCIEILSKCKFGLTSTELIYEIRKTYQEVSLNILESIILNDLCKNNNIECTRLGIFKHNNNNESLVELFFKNKIDSLSNRSRNGVLTFFKGYPLFKSIKYYLIDNNFKSYKLKNIGEKSIKEINQIVKDTIVFYHSLNHDKNKNDEIIKEIKFTKNVSLNTETLLVDQKRKYILQSPYKITLLENYVKKKIEKLTVRSRNAILSFYNGYPNHSQIENSLISFDFYSIKIKNVGQKCSIELNDLANDIKAELKKILDLTEDKMIAEKIKFQNILGFELNDEFFINKFIEKKLPIASLIKKYFDSFFKLNQKSIFVLNAHFYFFSHKITNDEIVKLGLTKERVRQIKQRNISSLSKSISSFSDLTKYADQYQIFLNKHNFISLDNIKNEDILSEINDAGSAFFLFVLECLFKNNLYTLTKEDKIERPLEINRYDNYEKLKKIKGNYIVNKSLIKKEELLTIHNVLLSAFSRTQKNDVVIKLSDIIKKKITSEIENFLNIYINNEFGNRLTNGYVYITKSSIKLTYEFIEEALVELNKLSSLDEIMIQLNEKHPYEIFIKESIRNMLTRYKDKFIFERRQTSLYGLKKWEEANKGIKGGTIGNLAYEFIINSKRICHINDVIDYILIYRLNSSRASILTTLKTGKAKKIFNFFKGGLVDLKDNYKINGIQGLKNISID